MSSYGARVPQTLSKPSIVLWWEMDEALIIFGSFGAWVAYTNVWSFAFLAVVPYVYVKSKSKSSNGFLKHLVYRTGLFDIPGYPSALHNEFRE